ncbi:hypothetical protein THAOC_02344 [Thalassiosira oceanica]|uniref:Uncharacterized protein n=1 Tax=Thalassiosira oceanica TaxID=159749 RepID=K0TM60_THAOC|nr:hypothetical protein THAOC_02344 [Thalassiosira oceanica]|eukprot:EJK75916.1 hypothetical protein THAOC_02344 [Thalassiosira oceanica]
MGIGRTRERCSGRRWGLSCSAECPLQADGSIGSVRGLRRPQTTIDASSAVDLSAPMCSRPSHERFFLSHVSLLQAADVAGNQLSLNRADEGTGERYCLVPSSAQFGDMSSDETAATCVNDSVGRSVGRSTSYRTVEFDLCSAGRSRDRAGRAGKKFIAGLQTWKGSKAA